MAQEFVKTWNFADISSEGGKYNLPEVLKKAFKMGEDIYETIFEDGNTTVFIMVVDTVDTAGAIEAESIYVYDDLLQMFERMNEVEYTSNVSVNCYQYAESGHSIHMYYKVYDAAGYSRFSQVKEERPDFRTVIRGAWDKKAKVFNKSI